MSTMGQRLLEMFSVALKAADAAARDARPDTPEEDRCVAALNRLKDLVRADRGRSFKQVEKRLRQLAKHPQPLIRLVASDVINIYKDEMVNRTPRKPHTVEVKIPGSEGVSVSSGEALGLHRACSLKLEDSLKAGPYGTDSDLSKKSRELSSMKAGFLLTACSVKVENSSTSNSMQVEISKTNENIGTGSIVQTGNGASREPINDENGTEQKKQSYDSKIRAQVVLPKLTSLPLTKDKMRDQLREILAEALGKVSTEVCDNLRERVSACDPYRVAASVETEMYEKWGRYDGPQEFKYRRLMSNIKDPENPDFRRRVLLGRFPLYSISLLTQESMSSDERWLRSCKIKDKASSNMPRFGCWQEDYACKCGYYESCRRGLNLRQRGLTCVTDLRCIVCDRLWLWRTRKRNS